MPFVNVFQKRDIPIYLFCLMILCAMLFGAAAQAFAGLNDHLEWDPPGNTVDVGSGSVAGNDVQIAEYIVYVRDGETIRSKSVGNVTHVRLMDLKVPFDVELEYWVVAVSDAGVPSDPSNKITYTWPKLEAPADNWEPWPDDAEIPIKPGTVLNVMILGPAE